MPKKSSKPSRNNKGRAARRFTSNAFRARSVQYAAVQQTADAFSRTVFDPVHARSYDPIGIPDLHQGRSLCYKMNTTFGLTEVLTNGAYVKNTNGTFSSYTPAATDIIDYFYVVQDYNPFKPFLLIVIGHASDNSYTFYGRFFPGTDYLTNLRNDKDRLRCFAKSCTIQQIGAYADRGGYCEVYQLPDSLSYDSATDKYSVLYDIDEFENNRIDAMNALDGVYSILKPNNKTSYTTWHQYDSSVPFTIRHNGVNVLQWEDRFLAQLDRPNLSTNIVKLVPPGPIVYGDGAITRAFNFRITIGGAVEYQSDTGVGVVVPHNPGILDMTLALSDHILSFYPASFNDFRKILASIKKAYKNHQPLVDAALGAFTPGRSKEIKLFLDRLVDLI